MGASWGGTRLCAGHVLAFPGPLLRDCGQGSPHISPMRTSLAACSARSRSVPEAQAVDIPDTSLQELPQTRSLSSPKLGANHRALFYLQIDRVDP